jgi:deoxyribose-phosphate aldolase
MKQIAMKLASMIDHTLLKLDATQEDFIKLCEEAKKYHFATVCVRPNKISFVANLLKESSVKPIAVISFPHGTDSSQAKIIETKTAIKAGAKEIDMVINIDALKSKNYKLVYEDIKQVVEAAKPYIVKVIIETSELDHDEKVSACTLAKAAGAAFVKTSTGFSSGGATVEDIMLMRKIVGNDMKIKASGGIRTKQDAEKMVKAGADRIGTSAGVIIVTDAQTKTEGY